MPAAAARTATRTPAAAMTERQSGTCKSESRHRHSRKKHIPHDKPLFSQFGGSPAEGPPAGPADGLERLASLRFGPKAAIGLGVQLMMEQGM
jgi:hypothetical protein